MSTYFKPYEGREPYIFISYAHKNSERVLRVIRVLHDLHYRLWYDEGIPAGSDWPKNIDTHMRGCESVLFFISSASLRSGNCMSEIQAAAKQGKPILCVRIDEAALNEEWKALLKGAPFAAFAVDANEQAERILEAGIVTERILGSGGEDAAGAGLHRRFNAWTIGAVLGAALFLLAGAGAFGLAKGYFPAPLPEETAKVEIAVTSTPAPTPVPTLDLSAYGALFEQYIEFPDALQEKAIRAATGVREGQVSADKLLSITELHFCGNMALSNDEGIAFDTKGDCRVNDAPVIRGEISSLLVIAQMPALERLSLVEQQVKSIKDLEGLIRLRELNIAGNPIDSLTRIEDLPSLKTLHLEHTEIADLTPLGLLPSLTAVTVSADMFPMTIDSDAHYDVILVQ